MASRRTGKTGATGSGSYGANSYEQQFSDIAKPTPVANPRSSRRPRFPKSPVSADRDLKLGVAEGAGAIEEALGSENKTPESKLSETNVEWGSEFPGLTSILIHVQSDDRAILALKMAVDLASRSNALLIGVGTRAIPPTLAIDPLWSMDSTLLATLKNEVNADLRVAEATFNRYASAVRHEWRIVDGEPAMALTLASRAADLIIAWISSDVDRHRSSDPAELALLTGRPVLVVPSLAEKFCTNRIIVAWKDTREARRAAADALPFLASASDVVVLEVCAKKAAKAAQLRVDDAANGLRRHGVKARGKVVTASENRIFDVICAEAQSAGSALLVTGCYGHSRLNEWLFGGVTRQLLHQNDYFIFMSH